MAAVLAELREPREDGKHPLVAAVGGVRGIIDSAAPTTAFVLADTVGSLRAAVIAAVSSGIVLLLLRIARREPREQALSGLAGVAFAAAIAMWLHRGSGYFLPGLIANIGYATAALVSVAVRRPFVGYVASVVDPRLEAWRTIPTLRRAAGLASLLWAVIFIARVGVQGPLYLANDTGWLGAARLAMGWPLWAVAVGGSVWLMRRATARAGLGQSTLGTEGQDAPSARPS